VVASTENEPALGVLYVFLALRVETLRVKGVWVIVAVERCAPKRDGEPEKEGRE
jgi:hypothetical protein